MTLVKINSYAKDDQEVNLFIKNAKGLFDAEGMVVKAVVCGQVIEEEFTMDQQKTAQFTFFEIKDQIKWGKK